MNMSNNKCKEHNVAPNFFMDIYQDGGKTNRRFSTSEPYLEKMAYNLDDERTELRLECDTQEFRGNCLDDDSGLIEQEMIMAGIEGEKCQSLDGLNDETNLEELECQHSKINEEYFDIFSLEGDAAHEEEIITNSHHEGVCFSRKNSEIKSPGMGKVGPIHSGKKTKLSGVPRRKHNTKHLTTNEKHIAIDCKSSRPSSVSSSEDTCSGIDVEDQNVEADVLFLRLKSIGKLSVPDEKNTVFDLPNDIGLSLTSSSPENLELKSKKEDTCQKQYGDNARSFPSTDNHPKNIRVPELHFDEVADTGSSIKGKQSENQMKEKKTRNIDEFITLSIPKEIHNYEMERMKMKKRMCGKTEGSASAHEAKIQVEKDEMMPRIEQNIQSDKSTLNHWKTQGLSETQVKRNDAKILSKRGEIVRRELRDFAEDETPLPKSEKAEKGYSSCGVLVDIDACNDNSMASSSCPSFPSLSGGSSGAESAVMLTTTGSPCKGVDSFQEFERQNLAERKDLKKQFRLKIAEAKKMLMEARLLAQEETATKRFNEALKKHTQIKLKRAFMKDSMSKSVSKTPTLDPGPSSVVAVGKTSKDVSMSFLSEGVSDIQEIRKAEADFDRAKVKQFQTKMKLQKKKTLAKIPVEPQSKKLKLLKKKDRERLERYEVEKMISELRSLNMIDYANKLSQAMICKEEYEAKLRRELSEERKHAAQLAKKQKLEELARIREEEKRKKMAEKERLEQERREKEALEIAKRQAEAMKQREHNLKLQESLNYTLLATGTSRSFAYSYLPVLKPPAAQIKKNDREKLKKIKARYLEGL